MEGGAEDIGAWRFAIVHLPSSILLLPSSPRRLGVLAALFSFICEIRVI
jgi:hypothetical protein